MQQWIERIAWVLLTGLLIWLWNTSNREVASLTHLLEEQYMRLERQTAHLDSLSKLPTVSQDSTDVSLKRDLMSRPDVITVPGILGGTMRIFAQDHIRILNDSWVYAEFEDGHIQGAGLFQYSHNQDGRVTWKLIESRVF